MIAELLEALVEVNYKGMSCNPILNHLFPCSSVRTNTLAT